MCSHSHLVSVVGGVVVTIESIPSNLVQAVGGLYCLLDVEGLRVTAPLLGVRVGFLTAYAEVVTRPCALTVIATVEVCILNQPCSIHGIL